MKTIYRRFLVACVALLCPLFAAAGPVNVNTADAPTLSAELQGVGPAKAQAIVEYREAHGPFKSADDLTQVKGIGARTVDINRANIMLRSAGDQSGK